MFMYMYMILYTYMYIFFQTLQRRSSHRAVVVTGNQPGSFEPCFTGRKSIYIKGTHHGANIAVPGTDAPSYSIQDVWR